MRRTITTEQAVNVFIALSQIQGNLPPSLGFKIARLESKLKPIYDEFEKQRNELIRMHGTADPEKEGSLRVPAENLDDFMVDVRELYELSETIEFPKFEIEEFGDMKLPKSFFSAMADYIGSEPTVSDLTVSKPSKPSRKTRRKKETAEDEA